MVKEKAVLGLHPSKPPKGIKEKFNKEKADER